MSAKKVGKTICPNVANRKSFLVERNLTAKPREKTMKTKLL